MRLKLICTLVITLCFGALIARADSMELNNSSLIKGRCMGGTDTEIKFQVASSVQHYNITTLSSRSTLILYGVAGQTWSLCHGFFHANLGQLRLDARDSGRDRRSQRI